MQIEIPSELGQELVKHLLQDVLPYKSKREFAERPFETLFFNMFTQKLRDSIWTLTKDGELCRKIAKEEERNGLLMALLTMIVHKLGNHCVVSRAEDGEWYEKTGLRLKIEQGEEHMTLTVVEDEEGGD